MTLIATHRNTEVILAVRVMRYVYNLPLPNLHTPFPILPVPNKPCGICGR